MFEVLNIPLPPVPGGALGMLFGVAALLAGLALLLLGRAVVWRLASAATLGALGALLAAELAARTGHGRLWPAAICGTAMALIGLALARLFWATALAAVAAVAAELTLLHRMLPAEPVDLPTRFSAEGLSFGQWLAESGHQLGEWLRWMAESDPMLTILAGSAAALAGLILGLARPVAIRIFLTSAAGATLIVGGACLTITSLVGHIGLLAGNRPWALLAVGVVVAAAGMMYQVRSRKQAHKDEKDDDGGSDDKK